jgi:drug/metabolite transporter (DMT)-like permease
MNNQNQEYLDHLRHSCAHLLAAAVMELYPQTHRTIGPAIENGFYFDFEFSEPISDEDLPKIEAKMHEIVKNWKGFEKKRPATLEFLGGGVGVLGIGLLLSATKQSLTGLSSLPSILMLTVASISWTIGSLYQRQAKLKASPLLVSSIQMLSGGLFLIVGSTLSGEIFNLRLDLISQKSAISLLYLIFVGAIVGFSTYTYLIKNVEPAKVSTYALVNPVVAVYLGVALAGEIINATMILALLLVLLGVGLILLKPFLVKVKYK